MLCVSHFDFNWEIETFFWSDRLGQNCLMSLISSSLLPAMFCFHPMYSLVRTAMDRCLNWTVYSWNVYVRVFFLNYLPFLTYFNCKCFLEKPVSLHNYIRISRKTMVLILTWLFFWILEVPHFWGSGASYKTEIQNKTALERKFISFLAISYLSKIPMSKNTTDKKTPYKIRAMEKWNYVFMSHLPLQSRGFLIYKCN